MGCSRKCCYSAISIGVILLALGLSVTIFGSEYFKKLYKDQLQLAESSTSYHLWIHTPVPLYFEAYLFNWTNAKEFLEDKSVVPHFEEVGPFMFKEVHDRVNLTWNDNNTVSYNQIRKWEFVPEESVDLSTPISNLNIVATTVAQFLKNFPKLRLLIDIEFNLLESFITTSSANNWLFQGIDDKVLRYINIIEEELKLKRKSFPEKFAWFYNRNMSETYDGRFTIKTGADDIYNVGMMDRWNGMANTKYYKGECGMVNGTSGELFPPMKFAKDDVDIFISDICSSIKLHRTGSTDVKGIISYTYVGTNSTFDNGQILSKNKCFCNGECAKSGARDVSSCRIAPLFFSFPHFYMADSSYRDSISGMNPNKSEHEFFISLDPITGVPTNIRAQFQVNVLVETISGLSMFKDVPKMYIPMMWFRERATITPGLAMKVLLIHNLPAIIVGLCYTLAGIGSIIAILSIVKLYRSRRKSSDGELLIRTEVDNENIYNVQD